MFSVTGQFLIVFSGQIQDNIPVILSSLETTTLKVVADVSIAHIIVEFRSLTLAYIIGLLTRISKIT